MAFAAFHVAGKIEVGSEGGWDYLTVDAAARRLYISHATPPAVAGFSREFSNQDLARGVIPSNTTARFPRNIRHERHQTGLKA